MEPTKEDRLDFVRQKLVPPLNVLHDLAGFLYLNKRMVRILVVWDLYKGLNNRLMHVKALTLCLANIK